MSTPVLSVRHLTVAFPDVGHLNYAVQDLSCEVQAGEIIGIVGESGCGKSVSSLAVMGILPPQAKVMSGQIDFRGTNLLTLTKEAHRLLRAKEMAMIFQNPMSSLNPYLMIGTQLTETAMMLRKISKNAALKEAEAMLERVHMTESRRRLSQYPHELSGGMCQRVMIAMALMNKPRLLIADEPTTALDVTIQSQILSVLSELMDEKAFDSHMAMVVISHDIGVIANMADRVMVMYAGSEMETAPTKTILGNARHPYTSALLSSIPDLYGPIAPLNAIPGNPPITNEPHTGCPYAPRCERRTEACTASMPPIAGDALHDFRCLNPVNGTEAAT